MALDMQLLAWDRHKNVVGINQLMGFQSYPLDNLISNSNTDINNKNPAQIHFHSQI